MQRVGLDPLRGVDHIACDGLGQFGLPLVEAIAFARRVLDGRGLAAVLCRKRGQERALAVGVHDGARLALPLGGQNDIALGDGDAVAGLIDIALSVGPADKAVVLADELCFGDLHLVARIVMLLGGDIALTAVGVEAQRVRGVLIDGVERRIGQESDRIAGAIFDLAAFFKRPALEGKVQLRRAVDRRRRGDGLTVREGIDRSAVDCLREVLTDLLLTVHICDERVLVQRHDRRVLGHGDLAVRARRRVPVRMYRAVVHHVPAADVVLRRGPVGQDHVLVVARRHQRQRPARPVVHRLRVAARPLCAAVEIHRLRHARVLPHRVDRLVRRRQHVRRDRRARLVEGLQVARRQLLVPRKVADLRPEGPAQKLPAFLAVAFSRGKHDVLPVVQREHIVLGQGSLAAVEIVGDHIFLGFPDGPDRRVAFEVDVYVARRAAGLREIGVRFRRVLAAGVAQQRVAAARRPRADHQPGIGAGLGVVRVERILRPVVVHGGQLVHRAEDRVERDILFHLEAEGSLVGILLPVGVLGAADLVMGHIRVGVPAEELLVGSVLQRILLRKAAGDKGKARRLARVNGDVIGLVALEVQRVGLDPLRGVNRVAGDGLLKLRVPLVEAVALACRALAVKDGRGVAVVHRVALEDVPQTVAVDDAQFLALPPGGQRQIGLDGRGKIIGLAVLGEPAEEAVVLALGILRLRGGAAEGDGLRLDSAAAGGVEGHGVALVELGDLPGDDLDLVFAVLDESDILGAGGDHKALCVLGVAVPREGKGPAPALLRGDQRLHALDRQRHPGVQEISAVSVLPVFGGVEGLPAAAAVHGEGGLADILSRHRRGSDELHPDPPGVDGAADAGICGAEVQREVGKARAAAGQRARGEGQRHGPGGVCRLFGLLRLLRIFRLVKSFVRGLGLGSRPAFLCGLFRRFLSGKRCRLVRCLFRSRGFLNGKRCRLLCRLVRSRRFLGGKHLRLVRGFLRSRVLLRGDLNRFGEHSLLRLRGFLCKCRGRRKARQHADQKQH